MTRLHSALLPFALLSLAAATAWASGPLNLNPNDPDNFERWANGGVDIPWNPDLGALGPLNNAAAVAQTQAAFQEWQGIATATATYSNNGPLAVDVTVANYAPFVQNLFFGSNTSDGLSPIVYDADGSIFLDLFGPSGILGFASPDTLDANGVPIEAVSFLNGGAILGGFPVADFFGVQVHEFGHYSGMAHTVVNGQNVLLGDTTGPTPFNTYGNSPPDQVETMYPFAAVGLSQFSVSPHADDIGFFSTMYPTAGFFAGSATISGSVLAPNGTTPLTGVNVIARNVANPFVDAVSAISGDRGTTGAYTINGLTPGAEYAVYVDQILQGGFSTPPISLPGPEEFYNGAGESNNATFADPPDDLVTVSSAAGGTAAGIDVILNTPGAGDPLPVGDDGFAEIFLPFTFEICGQEFDSVFINANGSLTFGSGDADFTESAGEMLSDQPRIAGVWDDLNPSAGGSVFYEQTNSSFTANWSGVPEYFATGSNTFSITLSRSSNHVDIDYGSLTASDGLAGVSCGGGVTSGFESGEDLSALGRRRINLHNQPARYEVFSFGTNDLEGKTVRFNGTTDYNDNWAEKNDTPNKARNIALPFDSIDVVRFTEIEPTGGDIDWYRFAGSAGTTLIAEVITGQLDSLIAVFDATTGSLLAADDDGGAGLLSRIQTALPTDGDYLLAVTTFPDFGLTGAGGSGGRYVLDLFAVDGILLDLGDDDSEEVALDFSFPFNGTSYGSVFVNSNGNLTFGSGDTDFTESVGELLSDQPRIAPLWDDLSPQNGGMVTVEQDASSATITFDSVPEFFTTGSNTFAVTLFADGTVTIDYGSVSAVDGLVGVTEGGGAGDPGASDLSAGGPFSVVGTTYELFSGGNPFDLDGASLSFDP